MPTDLTEKIENDQDAYNKTFGLIPLPVKEEKSETMSKPSKQWHLKQQRQST